MILAILNLISGLFSLAGRIFDYLNARKMVDIAKTEQKVKDLKAQIDAAQKALQARLDVERDEQLNPGGVHDDDGFKRSD